MVCLCVSWWWCHILHDFLLYDEPEVIEDVESHHSQNTWWVCQGGNADTRATSGYTGKVTTVRHMGDLMNDTC